MITRLLVANRGEIARRIFATCRAMGVATVAVYSDADADSPHVVEADRAVGLPGGSPAETYLRADLLVDAARRAGADAVHPGYGFLSESADFAAAVLAAGLTWVGPPPEAIAHMGSKTVAKDLVAAAGVPVLSNLDPHGSSGVDDMAYPLLVKAAAGGGGRGMRIVRTSAELDSALASARQEAESAFGDGTVFCERYVERSRHVEVQVLADTHGAVVALGERECSIQRRHQKIVEEAPSAAVGPQLRARLFDAAVAAARAVGYTGAGTVEFLLAPGGDFYFLEMNTRLQVEHPVTECVTGLDLVRCQLDVAEGRPLPFDTTPVPRGHAIEVRLYAEDPAAGWRPSTGALSTVEVPGVAARFAVPTSYGVRLDSGVEAGSAVTPYYDAMLAKVIAWAPDRAGAARLLADTLTRTRLHGVTTNRDLLVRVLRHEAFAAAETDTGFLADHPEVTVPLLDAAAVRTAALAAALAGMATRRAAAMVLAALPAGWRNNPSQPQRTSFECPSGTVEVAYRLGRDGTVTVGEPGDGESGGKSSGEDGGGEDGPVRLLSAEPTRVVLETGGLRREYHVDAVGSEYHVDCDLGGVTLREVPRFTEPGARLAAGSLVAPMPGSVLRVAVSAGEPVRRGQLLLTLEAMKMEHPVRAPADGTVEAVHVGVGDQVDSGAVLAVITAAAAETSGVGAGTSAASTSEQP